MSRKVGILLAKSQPASTLSHLTHLPSKKIKIKILRINSFMYNIVTKVL